MRIAHITDIHVTEKPRLSQIWGKRLWGTFQLYGLGRASQFSRTAQQALVGAVEQAQPDVVVVTGDLTSQSLPQEFEAFHELFEPLFSQYETLVIPGNHDTYTRPTAGGVRVDAYLGAWTGSGDYPRVRVVGDVAFVALCCSRPGLYARGLCPEAQLARLDAVLQDPSLNGKSILILMHYATRSHDGTPYDVYYECLANANALEAVLGAHGDRVQAILHGHVHRGYRTQLRTARGEIPILNPGTAGYAWRPEKKRTAHFNVVEIQKSGLSIERYFYNGEAEKFEPEPGGVYNSGW